MNTTSTTLNNNISPDSYRDRLSSVGKYGERKWVFAQKPKGKFYNARTYVSWFFFALFFAMPFIEYNGQPFFLFNIPKATFIIFGKIFWPQDFFIFGLTMVTFIVFIILFTAAFGRLFCGWVCPQTIFMEMLFRKVEYLIEGDAAKQKMLNNAPFSTEKLVKKTAKHVSFFLLSFIIANTFLSYIIGIKPLWHIITGNFFEHTAGFGTIVLFSSVFYAVYAFFREQVCTAVCPYGRLQSVLLDKNSMIVAYDYKRGEPRGKFTKAEDSKLGSCLDCNQCIKVCPTGIDIRNGTQMECVGCTACIDACNDMMVKTNRPFGLIRYVSENNIESGEPLQYTTRMKLYTGLLSTLIIILFTLLMTRKDIDATIMRTPGMLYQERGTDSISNLYNIKIANKTVKEIPLTLRMESDGGKVDVIGGTIIPVKKQDESAGNFFVILSKDQLHNRKTKIKIGLYEGNRKIDVISTNFLAPNGMN